MCSGIITVAVLSDRSLSGSCSTKRRRRKEGVGMAEGKRWVMGKKEAGRGCLLHHIRIKGIALTLSPRRALSIPANLPIDRCSSQTVPSSPSASRGPRGSPGTSRGSAGLPPRARKTTDYSGGSANKNVPCGARQQHVLFVNTS